MFQLLLPRYDGAIILLNWGAKDILIISLDTYQGYHQVDVWKVDCVKLELSR